MISVDVPRSARSPALRLSLAVGAAPLLSPLTGVGRYTREVLRAVERLEPGVELSYYTGRYSKRRPSPPGPQGGAWSRFKQGLKSLPYAGAVLRGARNRLGRLSPSTFDAYFEPNFILADVPARRRIVTIHDLSFLRHPAWHPKDRVRYLRSSWLESAKRADAVLVDSEFIRREVLDESGVDPAKVRVAYPGVDAAVYHPAGPGEPLRMRAAFGDYILFVGSLEPRKNLKVLLETYRRLPESLRREHPLLLAGSRGWNSGEVPELAAAAGARYLGYVSEPELAELYRGATALVYPSLYEGFGLPPVEAMACGCPVVLSSAGPLEEVVAGAGHYVDPEEPDSVAAGLSAVLGDAALRARLARLGLERSKLYRWEHTARALLDAASGGRA